MRARLARILLACLVVLGIGLVVCAWGCSFAPYPDGRGGGVLGVGVGPDGTVDTGGITGGLATILGIGAAVGVPGVGGLALLVGKFVKAVAERANLQGQAAGWEQREQAATVQAPLPGPGFGAGPVAGPVADGAGVRGAVGAGGTGAACA